MARTHKEQNSDPEIRQLCQHALEESQVFTVPRCCFFKQGALTRKWRPPTAPASQEWSVVFQIVIPSIYHKMVLSLAHDTPLAGHLVVNKACGHLLYHFYWPGNVKMLSISVGAVTLIKLWESLIRSPFKANSCGERTCHC